MTKPKLAAVCVTAVLAIAWLSLRAVGQSESSPGAGDPNTGGAAPSSEGAAQYIAPIPPPATKLEAFNARKGIVITKAYTKVGDISGDDGSLIDISAVEMSEAGGGGEHARGLLLNIHQRRGTERSALSYIDEDEIDALAAGCETLAKLQPPNNAVTSTDGSFRTRGELEIINANYQGNRTAGVRSMQYLYPSGQVIWATAYLRLGRLDELQHQLLAGKQALDNLKPAEK